MQYSNISKFVVIRVYYCLFANSGNKFQYVSRNAIITSTSTCSSRHYFRTLEQGYYNYTDRPSQVMIEGTPKVHLFTIHLFTMQFYWQKTISLKKPVTVV